MPLQTLPTPFGVLDIRFSPDQTLLGVATSTGSVALYRWHVPIDDGHSLHLRHLDTLQLFEETIIVTSLAWDLHTANQIYTSSTDGEITKVEVLLPGLFNAQQLPAQTDLESSAEAVCQFNITSLAQHSLEAWTVVTVPNHWRNGGVFSGGDDAALRFAPLVSKDSENGVASVLSMPWSDSRIHGAGVVAVLPLMDGFVLSGSYDDCLRVIQTPSTFSQRSRVLHELNLGGGVWRIKPVAALTSDEHEAAFRLRVLVSGMYAGAAIVDVERGRDMHWTSKIVARFAEHESMNYACDVQMSDDLATSSRDFVSCSFYDKRLCLWRF